MRIKLFDSNCETWSGREFKRCFNTLEILRRKGVGEVRSLGKRNSVGERGGGNGGNEAFREKRGRGVEINKN